MWLKSQNDQDLVIRKKLASPTNYFAVSEVSNVYLAVISEFTTFPTPTLMPSSIDVSALNEAAGLEGPGTLPDERMRAVTLIILGFFAGKTWLHRKELSRPPEE